MSVYRVGSILDDKYEILERLGAGGMGEVFRVRHVHLHEQRVIKILRQDRAADPTAIQRFSQEARIATQIKHPNVAILYDFSRLEDGSFYMVWEHIEGEDVGIWLRARGPFPIQLALDLGIQGLRGLEAIHSAGVIHRDISPDNLMITRDVKGRALCKIIDLGLAKNLASGGGRMEITQAGMFMGKLMYCSPEQAGSLKEGTIDHRSDLYSFGAVLYEMICGLPPFESENEHGFVFKRLAERCRSSRATRRCGCPRAGEGRAPGVARNREERYPDAWRSSTASRGWPICSGRWRPRSCRCSTPSPPRRPAPRPVTPMPASAPPRRRSARRPASSRARSGSSCSPRSTGRPPSPAWPNGRRRRSRRASSTRREPSSAGSRRPAPASGARRPEANARRARPDPRTGRAERQLAELEAAITAALAAGQPDEAAAHLDAAAPEVRETPAFAALQRRVESVQSRQESAEQLRETEALLSRYIKERKQPLARLALAQLLEIAPNHPQRADYETWVEMIGQEAAQLEEAERLVESGREAILAGDLRSARRQLRRSRASIRAGASGAPRAEPKRRSARATAGRGGDPRAGLGGARWEPARRGRASLRAPGRARAAAGGRGRLPCPPRRARQQQAAEGGWRPSSSGTGRRSPARTGPRRGGWPPVRRGAPGSPRPRRCSPRRPASRRSSTASRGRAGARQLEEFLAAGRLMDRAGAQGAPPARPRPSPARGLGAPDRRPASRLSA